MRKHFICAICILGVLVVLFSCCPLSAFAVDPVSASVIANSFAQAIAAYGASNGVAMTFDVGSTDGIGETVHELWSDFRAGTQDADDYDTLAAALFPNLYYKALSAAGTAAEAYTVGVSITSEYAEEFDNFYNWLLSGPAEMVQVDNQYYQFAQSQIGSNASSIPVYSGLGGNFLGQPAPFWYGGGTTADLYNASYKICVSGFDTIGGIARISTSREVYFFTYSNKVVACSAYSDAEFQLPCYNSFNDTYSKILSWTLVNQSSNGLYYYEHSFLAGFSQSFAPSYSSLSEGITAISEIIDGTSSDIDSVGVKAYGNQTVADIPSVNDPNYDALNRAKNIPLNIPWDDTMFGDGSDALTGEEAGAIAGEVSGVLVEDQVIPLAEDEAISPQPPGPDDPSSDPDDYLVPGLADIFPFCIPFDIYNFLSALAAAPVAPHFTATLDFPEAVGGPQTIDIDFDSPTWNQLAQLLRLLELLAFIIGLALLTRSMFIRG